MKIRDRLSILFNGDDNFLRKDKVDEQLKELNNKVKVAQDAVEKNIFSTPAGTDIDGYEWLADKRYNRFYFLYSELPGAKQAVAKIADSVISGGFTLERQPDDETEYSGEEEISQLLKQPNNQDTFIDIINNTNESLDIYGNAYWYLVRESDNEGAPTGDIKEIWVLPADKMSILVDKDLKARGILQPVGYSQEVDIAGVYKKINYEVDDIIHFKLDNPNADVYGESPFETNKAIYEMVVASMTWNIAFFENYAKPSFAIKLPEGTNAPTADVFSKYWEKNFKGARNAHKNPVLYGNADIVDFSTSPKDLEFLNWIKYSTKLVAGGIGVPMSLIGISDDVNRASSQSERRTFLSEKIIPRQKYIEGKINKELIQEHFEDEKRLFKFGEIDVITEEEKANYVIPLVKEGIMNRNQGRQIFSQEPIEEDWANVYTYSTGQGVIPMEEQIIVKGYFDDYTPSPNRKNKTRQGKVLPQVKDN